LFVCWLFYIIKLNVWQFQRSLKTDALGNRLFRHGLATSLLMKSFKVYLVVFLGLLDPTPEEALPPDLGHRNGGRWIDWGRFFCKGWSGLQDVNIFTANSWKKLRVTHKLKEKTRIVKQKIGSMFDDSTWWAFLGSAFSSSAYNLRSWMAASSYWPLRQINWRTLN